VTGSLLDTSVLIAADPAEVGELPVASAISVVTLGELRAGVLLARAGRVRALRSRRLEAVRAGFLPLPVDEHVAERYGDLLALARRQGRAVKASDLLIVATAAATSRELYTLDQAQGRLARAAGVPVAWL
jgi:predicted nucleic acid-binding protein